MTTQGDVQEIEQQDQETEQSQGDSLQDVDSKKTAPYQDENYMKRLRQENASSRIEREELRKKLEAEEEKNKQIAKIFGYGESDAVDPEELASKLAQRDQEIRNLRIDNALSEALTKNNANPRLTKALLTSEGILGDLDPVSEDFATKLDEAVKQVIESNPVLRNTSITAPTAGAQHHSGNGREQQLTGEDLKKMTPEQIVEAKDKGLFNVLMGRR